MAVRLHPFQASQRYCLIDQRRLDAAVLERSDTLLALLFRLERAGTREVLREVLALLAAWFAQDAQSPLRRAVRLWVERELGRRYERLGIDEPLKDVQGKEGMMDVITQYEDFSDMLLDHGRKEGVAQGLATGRAEGRQEGRQEGRGEGRVEGISDGQRAALLRIVEKRFGTIPPAVALRIEQAATAQTQAWIDSAIDADSLAAVFGGAGTNAAAGA